MAPPRPPLTGMNARWALLGTNKQLLPCKCWQAHRCYLNKRPVCLVSQCFQMPVSDGWVRLILALWGPNGVCGTPREARPERTGGLCRVRVTE
jgi:hypothetical protein